MQVVIPDTDPLNCLVLMDCTELLPRLFNSTLIPDAICNELTDDLAPERARAWLVSRPSWLMEQSAQLAGDALLAEADVGEQAVIRLAIKVHADLLLIDDRAATRAARALGFRATGTLGLLVLAAQQGAVDLEDAFRRLKPTSFRFRQVMLDVLHARYRLAET